MSAACQISPPTFPSVHTIELQVRTSPASASVDDPGSKQVGGIHVATADYGFTNPKCALTLSGIPASIASTDFTAIREYIDQLEHSGAILPGQSHALTTYLASNMQIPYADLLWYYYHFSPQQKSVDLQPGMRLQVQYSSYQFVDPESAENGFVGAGEQVYHIVLQPNGKLGFETTLGPFTPFTARSQTPDQIANVVDLHTTAGSHRCYRLIYPDQIPAIGDASQVQDASANIVLLGADVLTDLETATSQFIASRDPSALTKATCLVFVGRTWITPQIPIFMNVDGVAAQRDTYLQYVPLGTTLRDVITHRQAIDPRDIPHGHHGYEVSRLIFYPQHTQQAKLNQRPVRMNQSNVPRPYFTTEPEIGRQLWELPLVAGDQVRLGA